MINNARLLFLDIETTPNAAYVWGKYQQDVIRFIKESEILCYAAKWLDATELQVGDWRDGKRNMVKSIWLLLDEADIVVAHNGLRFDVPKVNVAFLKHGLPPPSPYKVVDTKKAAKQYFFFNSNKLDDIGGYLNEGRKLGHEGFDLWLKCMKNDPEAWVKMLDYNRQDVLLLERIYLKLRPWIANHPNVNEVTGGQACPKCGHGKSLSRGLLYYASGTKQRRRCNKCKGYFKVSYRKNKIAQNIV